MRRQPRLPCELYIHVDSGTDSWRAATGNFEPSIRNGTQAVGSHNHASSCQANAHRPRAFCPSFPQRPGWDNSE